MPELPKLSQVVKSFTAFEDQVEQTLSQTGFTPPPGPMKTLASFMEQFEAAAPQLPEQLPQFPTLPIPEMSFPFGTEGGGESLGEGTKVKVGKETPRIPRKTGVNVKVA